MLHLLKRHPIPIEAFFRHSLVLTYAFPAGLLEPLLPPGLALDTYREYGFLAIALVQAERLRPSFLPAAFGHDFFLSGYRIFARFESSARSRRGLRILRSDTDKPWMVHAENLLTHYRYGLCRVEMRRSSGEIQWRVRTPREQADLEVSAEIGNGPAPLPPGSPFTNQRHARRFAGPLPYTFDYEPETRSIISVRGLREHWNPQPVTVTVGKNTFLRQEPFCRAIPILANAFYLNDVPVLLVPWRPRPSGDWMTNSAAGREPYQGVRQIVQFNRRSYVWALVGSAAALLAALHAPPFWRALLLTGMAPALFWACSSLAVSYYVYDLFPLYDLTWLSRCLLQSPRRWLNIHAGLDETSHLLAALFPSAEGEVLDIFDPHEMTEPSIERARRMAPTLRRATPASWRSLPSPDNTFDAAFLIFAAHELRRKEARLQLLRELARILRPGGELVLVEHLRDWRNFLAFGPGCLHFLSRRAWRRAADGAGLEARMEMPMTPFVRVFVFRRKE